MARRWSRSTANLKWTNPRRKRQIGSFSGGVIHYQGDVELMKILQQLSNEAQLDEAIEDALMQSAKPVQDYMNDFMDSHLAGMPTPPTQNTPPRGVGQTKKFMGQWLKRDGHRMELLIGYQKRDWNPRNKRAPMGLAALFLDIGTRDALGTPRVRPTFFIYYAVQNNLDQVRMIQNRVINRYIDTIVEG